MTKNHYTTTTILQTVNRHWRLTLVLIISLLISRLGINLPLLVLSIYTVYQITSRLILPQYISSKSFLAVTSFFLYILILQSVSLVTWLFAHDFPLSLNIFASLLISIGIYYPLRHIPLHTRDRFTIGDIVSLCVVLATLVVFIVLPVKKSGAHDPSALITLVNYNVDDGSHLSMINTRLQYNVAATVGNKADIAATAGVSYPSGWPAANASIIQALSPSITTGSTTLIAYILIKSFWLLFLVFVVTRTVFSLCDIFGGTRVDFSVGLWIGLGSFLFTAWFLVDPFFYGFFSFIPQLITIPLFLLTTMQLSSLNKPKEGLLAWLMIPSLLAVGTALSWFLLFPIFVIALALCIFMRITSSTARAVLTELTMYVPKYLLFYMVITLSVISQLYMTLGHSATGVSTTFVDSLLLNGGIDSYPTSFYFIILVGLALFCAFAKAAVHTPKISAILNYVAPMLAFAGFVYLLQQYKIHDNIYYYFKILNTVTLVGILFAIVGIAMAIKRFQNHTSPYAAILLTVVTALTLLQFGYPNAPLIRYAQAIRSISPATNSQIYAILKNDATQHNYNDGVVTIFYPTNNALLNEVASNLIQSNKPYNECYRSVKGASFQVPASRFDPTVVLKNCSSKNHVVYYVDPSNVNSMKKKVAENNLSSQITIKTLQQ